MADFIAELFAFALMIYVIVRYVRPPAARLVNERLQAMKDALDEAERGRALLREARERHEATIAEARKEARALVEQSSRLADQIEAEMRETAGEEHEAQVARASLEIERATQRASDQLRRQMADLVIDMAERVLERELDAELQSDLIDEATAIVESEAAR